MVSYFRRWGLLLLARPARLLLRLQGDSGADPRDREARLRGPLPLRPRHLHLAPVLARGVYGEPRAHRTAAPGLQLQADVMLCAINSIFLGTPRNRTLQRRLFLQHCLQSEMQGW